MAVITAAIIIPLGRSITIYTDSANVISQQQKYKNLLNINHKVQQTNFILWEIFEEIKHLFKLNINFIKVKAHSGVKWNEKADELAKEGTTGPFCISHPKLTDIKCTAHWYGTDIDNNLRTFIKKVNNAKLQIKINELKRLQTMNLNKEDNINWGWSKNQLNIPYTKKKENTINIEENKGKKETSYKPYFNKKKDNEKAFKIKKMFDELPVMEIQKKRFPKIYSDNLLCPRCQTKKETIEHLWECSKADNDILYMQRTLSIRMRKLLYSSEKFKDIEDLMDELFPFFKIKKNLKRYTKANRNFYSRFENKKYKKEYTYEWDGQNSMDCLLRGFIPTILIDILTKYLKIKSKNAIKQILMRWMGKLNNLFFEKIWKPRNEVMIEWEKSMGITKTDKKKKINKGKRKENCTDKTRKMTANIGKIANRERLKNKKSGNKKDTGHTIDENLYYIIKQFMGLNSFIFTTQ
jgi:hypothetical protein